MQLKDKCLHGLVKSFSLVDSTLIQQGFKRCGKAEEATYQLTIQDSATQNVYSLLIPTKREIQSNANHHDVLRIGRPSLKRNGHIVKLKPAMKIPEPIWNAVQSKLAEIADYLQAEKS